MFSSNLPLDQTAFSAEQPALQDPELTFDQMEKQANKLKKKPIYKQKKFIVVIPLIFIVLVIVLLLLLPKKPEPPEEEELVLPPSQEQTSNYMVERIRRLQAELKEADPTKTDILFPPVDMKLELDPAE